MKEWIIGFAIATLVALTGMGGGSFTMPMLVLVGLPLVQAVGTAMVFSAILRLGVAPVYLAGRNVHPKYLGLLLAGSVPGLLLGTWIMRLMNGSSWKAVMLLIVGVMLVTSSAATFITKWQNREFGRANRRWLPLLALPIGMETGYSSAGAGAFGIILLLNYSKIPVRQAVGTDILFGIVLALIGSGFHLAWGSVNSPVLLRLLIGGLPGAVLGCMLAKRVSGTRLRATVALVAIALGLQLVVMGGWNLLKK